MQFDDVGEDVIVGVLVGDGEVVGFGELVGDGVVGAYVGHSEYLNCTVGIFDSIPENVGHGVSSLMDCTVGICDDGGDGDDKDDERRVGVEDWTV